ncbi:Sexual differentiation process protein isp7 [Diplonema papillatum]|nr:Sexual differentiation process protein isp7 [Diplonema papillatum]
MTPNMRRRVMLANCRCSNAHRRQSAQVSSFANLPVIDVGAYVRTGRVGTLAGEITEACASTGFFQVAGLPVARRTKREAYAALRAFFERPTDEKRRIHVTKTGGLRGYIGVHEQGDYGVDASDKRLNADPAPGELRDYKEVFTLGTERPADYEYYFPDLFGKNAWPDIADFETRVSAYYEEVLASSHVMYSLFARCLGQEPTYFTALTAHPMNSMNCIYYPPQPAGPERSVGIGSHTDFECFTLLSQDDVPGLEILDDGGEWHLVPADPEVFVVNIGDLLARWSNDKMRSTVHRAHNPPAGRGRQSIAFFCAPSYDAVVRSLDQTAPARYPPVLAGEHLRQRIAAANAIEPSLYSRKWSGTHLPANDS